MYLPTALYFVKYKSHQHAGDSVMLLPAWSYAETIDSWRQLNLNSWLFGQLSTYASGWAQLWYFPKC